MGSELEARSVLSPKDKKRMIRVGEAAQRLEEAHQLRREFASETEDARRTVARAMQDRCDATHRLEKTQQELRDAELYVDLMGEQRAVGLRRLGQNDNARRQLAQKHAELALEHERTRNELAAAGLDPSGRLLPSTR